MYPRPISSLDSESIPTGISMATPSRARIFSLPVKTQDQPLDYNLLPKYVTLPTNLVSIFETFRPSLSSALGCRSSAAAGRLKMLHCHMIAVPESIWCHHLAALRAYVAEINNGRLVFLSLMSTTPPKILDQAPPVHEPNSLPPSSDQSKEIDSSTPVNLPPVEANEVIKSPSSIGGSKEANSTSVKDEAYPRSVNSTTMSFISLATEC